MKTLKFIVLTCCVAISTGMSAQTDSTKTEAPKAHNSYLPVKGSFGIGADATPLFDFV